MKIEDAQKIHEDRLMRLPNVTGVGIGERDGQKVIKVFVSRKLPEPALRPGEIVDKFLEGYPTVVEEIGTVTAQPR